MSNLIFPESHTRRRIDPETAPSSMPVAWQENFSWRDRADYLDWVAQWKARLHRKIAEIREQRERRRDRTLSELDRNIANFERQELRIDCYNLQLIRRIGKQYAARATERQQAA